VKCFFYYVHDGEPWGGIVFVAVVPCFEVIMVMPLGPGDLPN